MKTKFNANVIVFFCNVFLWLTEIAVSDPAGVRDACLLWVLCVV